MTKAAGMMIIMVSGLVFIVGKLLFGISVILAGVFSTIAAVLWMIGFLPTPLGGAYPKIGLLGVRNWDPLVESGTLVFCKLVHRSNVWRAPKSTQLTLQAE
jgi:hypothetical protein